MTRFYLDWLLDGISSAHVTVQPAVEEPAVRDEPWYRPCPESIPDTRFSLTRHEVADAEDAVLDDLAALMAAQGLSPWAAADRLFNRAGLPPVSVGHQQTQKPSVAGEEADPVSV